LGELLNRDYLMTDWIIECYTMSLAVKAMRFEIRDEILYFYGKEDELFLAVKNWRYFERNEEDDHKNSSFPGIDEEDLRLAKALQKKIHG